MFNRYKIEHACTSCGFINEEKQIIIDKCLVPMNKDGECDYTKCFSVLDEFSVLIRDTCHAWDYGDRVEIYTTHGSSNVVYYKYAEKKDRTHYMGMNHS